MPQSDFWNKLKQRFTEVSSAAADFTEEKALIAKLKWEILMLKRKRDKINNNIGDRIYELSKEEPRQNPFEIVEINNYIDEIDNIIEQIEVKRKESSEIAENFRNKDAENKGEGSDVADGPPPFVPPEKPAKEEKPERAPKPEPAPKPKKAPKPRNPKPPKSTTKKKDAASKTKKAAPKKTVKKDTNSDELEKKTAKIAAKAKRKVVRTAKTKTEKTDE